MTRPRARPNIKKAMTGSGYQAYIRDSFIPYVTFLAYLNLATFLTWPFSNKNSTFWIPILCEGGVVSVFRNVEDGVYARSPGAYQIKCCMKCALIRRPMNAG